MRAFIQAFRSEPWNVECETAKLGFEKLGIECILFNNTDELNKSTEDDVVVGGLLMLSHQLNRFGKKLLNLNYPEELSFCYGRSIWQEKLGDVRRGVFRSKPEKRFPVFIKPLEEKICTGDVIDAPSGLKDYASLSDDTVLLCSDPVKFVSEWRYYVRYNEVLGRCNYNGDKTIECDQDVVRHALAEYRNAPAGYAIDFGVTNGNRTVLVEVNDGYAIGNYGLDDALYALFLTARWREIFDRTDAFRERSLRALCPHVFDN